MLNTFKAWGPAYRLIFKDKASLLLAMIPILIGVTLYIFLGNIYFTTFIEYGQQYIEKNLSDGTFGQILYYLAVTLLTIVLYFVVNWTFVLVLSIIASPFNDLLSERIEKVYLGEKLPTLGESFSGLTQEIFKTIINEIKKVILIIAISIVGAVISFIPILAPVSICITIILLAVGYVDYSWSRHNMVFADCKKDVRKNLVSYAAGGGIFMLIISIPVINIIVPSLATSYFTVLWIMNNEHRNKITQ